MIDDNIVDSTPPQRNRRQYVDYGSVAPYAAHGCAWLFGIPSLIILLALIFTQDWASHNMLLARVWPFFTGFFFLLTAPCAMVIFWDFHKAKKEREREENRQRNEQRLLNEQVKLTRQANQLVTESRAQNDNVKIQLQYGDNGLLKSQQIEVIRADVLVQQALASAEGRVKAIAEKRQQAGGVNGYSPAPGREQKEPKVRRLVTPAPYDLIDVMRTFPLAEDNIFLGKGNERIFNCDPRSELCHGAFNAVTGRGKTIMVKGIESQILSVGHEVIHADIKFTLVDEKGNDYRPIAKALMQQGDIDMFGVRLPHLLLRDDHIVRMIEWLAGPELMRRLAMYARGDHSYKVLYVFLEELAYLVTMYKHLGPIIARLLVVGRSLGIKCFCVAQNFQVQNLKLNSGMRENFETAWFLGGDIHSGAALLDMGRGALEDLIKENNIKLGNGVSLFRNNTLAYEADILRAGMASNDFVYWFFGRADGFMLPDYILPTLDVSGAGGMQSNGLVVPAGGQKRDTQRNTGSLVNSDFIGGADLLAGVPKNGANEPVESVSSVPTSPDNDFIPQSDDKLVPDALWTDLAYWYGRTGNTRKALERIGLNNSRYTRHASYILESQGLKTKKGA